MRSARASSPDVFQMSFVSEMFGTADLTTFHKIHTPSLEDFPALKRALPLPFTGSGTDSQETSRDSGTSSSESSASFPRTSPWSKTSRESSPGIPKSREVWRSLATTHADLRSRLGTLVRLIYDGECSTLPTVTARDWRSPGNPLHPRLNAPRGEPLTETLGCRLSPEFTEWMMGFPVGWTAVNE